MDRSTPADSHHRRHVVVSPKGIASGVAQGGTKTIPQIRFTVGVSSCDLFLHGEAQPIWNVGGSIVVGQKRIGKEDGDLWLALTVEHVGSTFFVWSRKEKR